MSQSSDALIIQQWLREVMTLTGLRATPLAKAAGLAPSTLLRAMDPEHPGALEPRTIRKIVETFHVDPPKLLSTASGAGLSGFAQQPQAELVAVAFDAPPLFAGQPLTPTQGVWTVQTRALELAGYLPGDVVLADSAVTPRARDVVVAQILDMRAGGRGAETVLRTYDPPYLVTETADHAARQKPVLVDNERVSIWGPVIHMLRRRHD